MRHRQVFGFKAGAFRAEQDAARRRQGMEFRRRLQRRDDTADQIATTHRGAEHQAQPAAGIGNAVEHPRLFEHDIGAARRWPGIGIGPTVTRRDEAQICQSEIEHGARASADIHAELGADQNDRRWWRDAARG